MKACGRWPSDRGARSSITDFSALEHNSVTSAAFAGPAKIVAAVAAARAMRIMVSSPKNRRIVLVCGSGGQHDPGLNGSSTFFKSQRWRPTALQNKGFLVACPALLIVRGTVGVRANFSTLRCRVRMPDCCVVGAGYEACEEPPVSDHDRAGRAAHPITGLCI